MLRRKIVDGHTYELRLSSYPSIWRDGRLVAEFTPYYCSWPGDFSCGDRVAGEELQDLAKRLFEELEGKEQAKKAA